MVAVRVRPLVARETGLKSSNVVEVVGTQTVRTAPTGCLLSCVCCCAAAAALRGSPQKIIGFTGG